MTRLWPSLVDAGLLASCVSVHDFGAYWDKGFVDPALTGTWQNVGSPVADPGATAAPAVWTFTPKDTSYAARAMNLVAPRNVETREFTARSLRIGSAVFLMLRDPDGRTPGAIERYEVQGDRDSRQTDRLPRRRSALRPAPGASRQRNGVDYRDELSASSSQAGA